MESERSSPPDNLSNHQHHQTPNLNLNIGAASAAPRSNEASFPSPSSPTKRGRGDVFMGASSSNANPGEVGEDGGPGGDPSGLGPESMPLPLSPDHSHPHSQSMMSVLGHPHPHTFELPTSPPTYGHSHPLQHNHNQLQFPMQDPFQQGQNGLTEDWLDSASGTGYVTPQSQNGFGNTNTGSDGNGPGSPPMVNSGDDVSYYLRYVELDSQ